MAGHPIQIGQKLEVKWPSDGEFYPCSVVDYRLKTGSTKVVYPRNDNAVEEFQLSSRVWRVAKRSRGRPLLDPIVGKQIEIEISDRKLSDNFNTSADRLRCYVLRRAGPHRYDLLVLDNDRIAKSQNLADVEYEVVENPGYGRTDDEIIVEPLSDDAEPPSSPSHSSVEQSMIGHDQSVGLAAHQEHREHQRLSDSPQLSNVTARGEDLGLQMPLFAAPELMLENAPLFPPPPISNTYQGEYSVDGDDEGSEFDPAGVIDDALDGNVKDVDNVEMHVEEDDDDGVANGHLTHDKAVNPSNGDSATLEHAHREQEARAAVHRFVSVPRRPNESRRLAYVVDYDAQEHAHRLAWIDSVEMSKSVLNGSHEILDEPPKVLRKRCADEHMGDVRSSKRPRSELVGRWISIRDDPALVVGSRAEKHLVYFARDERVEEVMLSQTQWTEGGVNLSRYEEGGLVGKRIVVLDKGEDDKELLFEAFVVERVGTAKYRLLYTQSRMQLIEDLRNRDRHWDLVPLDAQEFRGRKIVSWSRRGTSHT